MATSTVIPKTPIRWDVLAIDLSAIALAIIALSIFIPFTWSIPIIILLISIKKILEFFLQKNEMYHALAVNDVISNKVTILFGGVNLKSIFEKPEKDDSGKKNFINLKKVIVCSCPVKLKANDEIMMEAELLIALRADVYGRSFEDANENIQRYNSHTPEDLQKEGKDMVIQLFSSFFIKKGNTSEVLSNEIQVEKDVKQGSDYKEKVVEFEKAKGVLTTIKLVNCNPEKKAQDAFDIVAKSKAARLSLNELTKEMEGSLKMNPEEAQYFIQTLFSDNTFQLKVKGLENLTSLVLPTGIAPKKKGEKK